jgi:adenylate kinase family enzyme
LNDYSVGKQFGEPKLVLLLICPKEIAKQRYLTRKIEERAADDEAMFEKRYEEYLRENAEIEEGYLERGYMVEADTRSGTDGSLKKLCDKLRENEKWMAVIRG